MYQLLLPFHIVAGTLSLMAGTYVLLRRKGDRIHRLAGKIFYYSMLVVAISAIILSVVNPNYFLGIIGVFTFYLNTTGKRYVEASRTGSTGKAAEWMITGFMFCFGVLMLFTGISSLLNSQSFGIVSVVFAMISLLMVRVDYRNYRQKVISIPLSLQLHLQRMSAAYISSLTAFLVVNLPDDVLHHSLNFIPWLLPTCLVVPFMIKWSRKYAPRT